MTNEPVAPTLEEMMATPEWMLREEEIRRLRALLEQEQTAKYQALAGNLEANAPLLKQIVGGREVRLPPVTDRQQAIAQAGLDFLRRERRILTNDPHVGKLYAEQIDPILALLQPIAVGTHCSVPVITACRHGDWTFEKDGRRCKCGVLMVDFGD